jgi:hypothetical protein
MQRAGLLEQSTRGWMLITSRTAILSKIKQTVCTKEDIHRNWSNVSSFLQYDVEAGEDIYWNDGTVMPINSTPSGDTSSNQGSIDNLLATLKPINVCNVDKAPLNQIFPSQERKDHHTKTFAQSKTALNVTQEYRYSKDKKHVAFIGVLFLLFAYYYYFQHNLINYHNNSVNFL